MIEVKELTVRDRGEISLDRVSFKWKNGLIYGVLGDASSGKDVLLRALAGVLPTDEGEVRVNGFSMQREPLRAKSCIGFVPNGTPLYEEMTPMELLHFAAEVRGLSYEKAVRHTNRALETVGLEERRRCLIGSLSAWESIRLGIAQALIGKNEFLILEQPTQDLDPRRAGELRELLKELGESHTVILSSESVEEIRKLCDHVLLLSDGRVELDLPVEEIGAELGAHFRAGHHSSEKRASVDRSARRRLDDVERDGEYEVIDLEEEKGGRDR